MAGESSLCLRCRSLQILSIFSGQRYETEEAMIHREELDIQVASLAELEKEQNCQSCRLLVAAYYYELTDHNTDDGEETRFYASRKNPRRTHCKLRPVRADIILQYDACGMEDKIATQILIEYDPAVPVMFQTWDQGRADAKQGEVSNPKMGYKPFSLYRGWTIALEHQSAVNGRSLLNRSLQKGEMVDYWQLKSLLDECERSHTRCNEKVKLAARGSDTTHVMLLDVSNRRMVYADIDTPYVALSYVWDYVDRDGYPGFKDGFPEGSMPPKLPCIMEDAIEIVRRLGRKYLWIDLLCIDQNNPVIKKLQIKQMDVVYSHAVLTIVVLARSNVHQGIPGVRPGSRKAEHHNICIQGQNLIMGTAWYHFYTIAGSTWNSRGWTLEEGMLSSRCLFFGPNEVFFDCGSGIGSETLGLPMYQESGLKTYSLQHSTNLIDYKFWNKSFPGDWSFSFYAQSVRFYSERDLSHARDSLNAFMGVLSRLTVVTGMRFVQGIPKGELLKGLLWFPTYSTSRLHSFPSWTWAAWTGPRHYCASYREIIDQTEGYCNPSTGPNSSSRFAEVTIADEINGYTSISIVSEVRQFSLRLQSSKESIYRPVSSNGRVVLQILGSRGKHDQGPFEQDLLSLETYEALASELTHFVYLLYWKDTSKKRDHVLAMLINEKDQGIHERVALCGIPIQAWNDAPVVKGLQKVTLV